MCTPYLNTSTQRLQAFPHCDAARRKHSTLDETSQKMGTTPCATPATTSLHTSLERCAYVSANSHARHRAELANPCGARVCRDFHRSPDACFRANGSTLRALDPTSLHATAMTRATTSISRSNRASDASEKFPKKIRRRGPSETQNAHRAPADPASDARASHHAGTVHHLFDAIGNTTHVASDDRSTGKGWR